MIASAPCPAATSSHSRVPNQSNPRPAGTLPTPCLHALSGDAPALSVP